MINLVFLHGWSVTNTSTYGDMPEALVAGAADAGLELAVNHIHLGRYISFHDEVTVDDIARALDRALRETLGGAPDADIPEFSCITHSTGGPVAREWVDRFYGAGRLSALPLKHLIMLAPANHGSALAALGKKRVGRIKAWMSGVETGQRVLDWLSLGSDEGWALAGRQLAYQSPENGFFPFVVTGQAIDEKFYDFLNNYLKEKGSDGVVRVAGGNMNYRVVTLKQNSETVRKQPMTYGLEVERIDSSEATALAVVPEASHSGTKIGIMTSIKEANRGDKPVVDIVLNCLSTETVQDYNSRADAMRGVTAATQAGDDDMSRYGMLVFQVSDDRGEILDDYDLLLLGNRYRPNALPKGFFVDKQMNKRTGRLTYYVDADLLVSDLKQIGFRVTARPERGFSHYAAGEFRSEDLPLTELIKPNQTLYVNIVLKRRVAKNVLRFGPVSKKPHSFKGEKPHSDILDE